MTKSLWFKRTALLMCLLVLYLCLVPGFQQPAKALVLVDDLAIFALGLLASSGIVLAASGGFSDAVEFVSSSLSDYASSLGSSLSDLIGSFSLSVVGQKLTASYLTSDYLSDWLPFFVNEYNIVSNSSSSFVDLGLSFVYYPLPLLLINSRGQEHIISCNSSDFYDSSLVFAAYDIDNNGRYNYFFFFTPTDNIINADPLISPSGAFINSTTQSGWSYGAARYNNVFVPVNVTVNPPDTILPDLNATYTSDLTSVSFESSSVVTPVVESGDELQLSIPDAAYGDSVADLLDKIEDAYISDELSDITFDTYLPDSFDPVTLDPAQFPLPVVVQGSVTTVLGGGSISINNGAEDAIPVYLPGGITLTWPTDGLPIDWPADGIPIDWGDAPSITMELPDTFFDDLTGAISDALDESYGLANQYKSPGLSDIFPFCIPFDIYHFFEALAADPVAPCFEIPFYVEGLVDYTFEIDLSVFESVAQVVRIMELLLFCVGLALVTRNLIRG